MLMQLFAEVQDTLPSDIAMAQAVAKAFKMNVSFYFDRVEYYVVPGGDVTSRTTVSQSLDAAKSPAEGSGPVGAETLGVGGTKATTTTKAKK